MKDTNDPIKTKGTGLLVACFAVFVLVIAVAPIGHSAGPASSLSWTMVDHQLVSGGGTQTAASYSVDACLSDTISGRQTSASYHVDAGCVTTVGQTVPVELTSFVIE